MNILLSVNSAYKDKAVVMLYSLKSNTNEKINVYLMNHSLSSSEIEEFQKNLEKMNIYLSVINTTKTDLDTMTIGNAHFSIEMYYRIIAQFLLPKELDRILWLDADIIILNDIYDFYSQNFNDKYMVVCPDIKYDSVDIIERKKELNLSKKHIYFNSGVLLLNLEKLRKDTNLENIIKISKQLEPKLLYPDQDILNYLYTDKVEYEDSKIYNYQVMDKKHIDRKKLKNIKILHYAGNKKPWDYKCIYSVSWQYWHYAIRAGKLNEFLVCYIKFLLVLVRSELVKIAIKLGYGKDKK